jgi:hypothetical protein
VSELAVAAAEIDIDTALARTKMLRYLHDNGFFLVWPRAGANGPNVRALEALMAEGAVVVEDASLEQETRWRVRLAERMATGGAA